MKHIVGKLWKRANLSIRGPDGEPKGALFSGNFERNLKEGSGNGAALVNLSWNPFWTQMMLGVSRKCVIPVVCV